MTNKLVKHCSKCNNTKPMTEFNKRKSSKDGLAFRCRECNNKSNKDYYKTINGLITAIYGHQKQKSKKRNHPQPNYAKDELRDWILSHHNFQKLWNNYVHSNYNTRLKPSCDRIKNHLPYTFKNLQLVTWEKNNDNAYSDRKNGNIIGQSKAVIGTNIKTGKIVEFHSVIEAGRVLKIKRTAIGGVCTKKIRKDSGTIRKSAGGYNWKFKNNICQN